MRTFFPERFVVRALLFLLVIAGLSSSAVAQNGDVSLGLTPYQSFHVSDIDSVNLSNGNVVIKIPLLDYPQRGLLKLSFAFLINSKSLGTTSRFPCVNQYPLSCQYYWNPDSVNETGATFYTPPQGVIDEQAVSVDYRQMQSPTGGIEVFYAVDTSDGAVHPANSNSPSAGQVTGDATGFWEDGNGSQQPTYAIDRYGIRHNGPVNVPGTNGYSGVLREDPNGNQITVTTGPNFGPPYTYIDTLGRVIPQPFFNTGTSTTDFSGCTGPLAITKAWIWSVPGPNGGTEQFKFCEVTITVDIPDNQPSPVHGTTITGPFYQSVVLPNNTAFTFEYNDRNPGDPSTVNYGLPTKITLPTGGTISYTYATIEGCGSANQWTRRITSKSVDAADGTGPHTWTYSWGGANATTLYAGTTTVTDPLGNQAVHTFTNLGLCTYFETEAQYYQGTSTLLKTVQTNYTTLAYAGNGMFPEAAAVPIRVTTTWPSGQVTKTEEDYDSLALNGKGTYGNVIANREYGYGSGAPGALLRTTSTNYQAFVNSTYLASNLLTLPSSVQTMDGGGVQRALTTYGYDESPSPSGVHGNQTSVHKWLNTTGGYLTSTSVYNANGTVASITDPNLNKTTYGYSSGYAGSGPTSVTNALSQTTSHTYDFNTGLVASTTDPNSQTTSHAYDGLWRLTSVTYPPQVVNGSPINGLTTICYTDEGGSTCAKSGPPYETVVTEKIDSSRNKVTTHIFDGLGRVSQNQLSSDPQGTDYAVLTYDADGRKASETNPYRTTSDSTNGVTSYQYDALNRTTLVTKPDGSTVSTSYLGNCATVTDEAGKTRQGCADGLGRMTQVTENPGGLGYVTNYQYDALNNLTSVLQNGSRQRTFVYDSLSRLTTSTNPETGTITYAYDADGNVITKKDARGITTTNSYDALNRIKQKSYSDGTMSAFFTYDGTGTWGVTQTNTIGRLMEAWTGTSCCANGGAEIFSYDPMGRILLNTQYTPAMGYHPVNYTYDLVGDMLTATNGVGVTISYAYNTALRPVSVMSSLVDAQHPAKIFTADPNNGYSPHGGLWLGTFGNGLTETNAYNNRLHACLLDVNSSGVAFNNAVGCSNDVLPGNILWQNIQYSEGADNGNIREYATAGAQAIQRSFTYDPLNRLSSMSGTGGLCTGLNWSYDAWGNRTSQTQVSGTCYQQPTTTITANNQLSGYGYDAAGNMTSQPGATYTYDAESRLASASGGSTTYVYDAEGRRVQKTVSGAWKDYIHDLQGNVVAEMANGPCGDPCWITGYVYLNGRMIAEYENSTTYFVTGDHLGSSRLLTGVTGSVQDCNGFYPYGEQDAGICTSNNTTTHKFTGKERDAETGNDDFGARYYSSSLGRFMSADWSAKPTAVPYANLDDPQTLNLYTYVHNNPVSLSDKDGHCEFLCWVTIVGVSAAVGWISNEVGEYYYLVQRFKAQLDIVTADQKTMNNVAEHPNDICCANIDLNDLQKHYYKDQAELLRLGHELGKSTLDITEQLQKALEPPGGESSNRDKTNAPPGTVQDTSVSPPPHQMPSLLPGNPKDDLRPRGYYDDPNNKPPVPPPLNEPVHERGCEGDSCPG